MEGKIPTLSIFMRLGVKDERDPIQVQNLRQRTKKLFKRNQGTYPLTELLSGPYPNIDLKNCSFLVAERQKNLVEEVISANCKDANGFKIITHPNFKTHGDIWNLGFNFGKTDYTLGLDDDLLTIYLTDMENAKHAVCNPEYTRELISMWIWAMEKQNVLFSWMPQYSGNKNYVRPWKSCLKTDGLLIGSTAYGRSAFLASKKSRGWFRSVNLLEDRERPLMEQRLSGMNSVGQFCLGILNFDKQRSDEDYYNQFEWVTRHNNLKEIYPWMPKIQQKRWGNGRKKKEEINLNSVTNLNS